MAGLEASDFKIYEDDKVVSEFESKQVILNPDVAAVMYTLLLVDVSGSITESGESDRLVDAAQRFTEKVGATQKVGVYAFDGDEEIHSVVPFTEAKGRIDGGLDGLRTYRAKDPSTNLYGAISQGLEVLDEGLQKDKRPLKFGTLVVFTDGSDRAARVTKDEMLEQLGDEKYANFEVFTIGVGAEIDETELKAIGRDGTVLAQEDEKVTEAFDEVAARIDAHSKRFYLLSYCTPARKGEHRVRIEAQADRNKKGQPRSKGSLEYEFSAEKFGPPPDCDPQRPPDFPLDKNLEPAPDDGKSKSSTARPPGGSADSGKGESKKKAKIGGGNAPRAPGGGG